jgi:hypothetical protein
VLQRRFARAGSTRNEAKQQYVTVCDILRSFFFDILRCVHIAKKIAIASAACCASASPRP